MPTDTKLAPTAFEAAAHESLVASLRNAHALEKQQITVLEAQLDLFGKFPDLHARVTDHIVETREQARRLEAGLEACGSSSSMLKDAFLSAMGFGQTSVQGIGEVAELKAVTADIMEEHLEIATYKMLLALADLAGKPELRPRLEESLREEEAMAEWFDQNLETITRRFVEIKASERQADAAPQDDTATSDGDASPPVRQIPENASATSANSRATAEAGPAMTPNNSSATMDPEATPRPLEQQASAAGPGNFAGKSSDR